MSDKDKLKVILAILAILSIPIILVLHAYTVATLWGWFVAPLFGLPLLSKAQALGFGMFVGYMTRQDDLKKPEDDTSRALRIFAYSYLKPVIVLGMAWILKTYFL